MDIADPCKHILSTEISEWRHFVSETRNHKHSRADLRTVSPKEASDFSPWVAKKISITEADSSGRELGLGESEAAVGGFSLDITADRLVAIETYSESRVVAVSHLMSRHFVTSTGKRSTA